MSVDATQATWKLSKQQVTSIQKLLLLTLADRADEEAKCWPSLKRIQADTLLDRKTIIHNRQELIKSGLLKYTGELIGKMKQIPVMQLTYVIGRDSPIDLDVDENFTSSKNGTGTSTKFGTLNLT